MKAWHLRPTVPLRHLVAILEHSKARAAIAQYPFLAAQLPADWLDTCARKGQIADTHRVYRMLATGGVGWGDDQLQPLEALIGRLVGRDPLIDTKLVELWKAKESRIDSLATELLLADALLASGHSIVVEPRVGTSHPEYLVDDRVLVEVKTYCSPMDEFPGARLKYAITHQVDSGCRLELTQLEGKLTDNNVSPIVKQLSRALDRSRSPVPGTVHVARHGSASVTVKVSWVAPELAEGSYLATSTPIGDPAEAVEDFDGWLLARLKHADGQMKAFSGRKVVILDVSLCRELMDAMAFTSQAARAVFERARKEYPRLELVLAQRQSNFGGLGCTPSLEAVFGKSPA